METGSGGKRPGRLKEKEEKRSSDRTLARQTERAAKRASSPYSYHDFLWMPYDIEDCSCDECWVLFWREREQDLKDMWPHRLPYHVRTAVMDSRVKCANYGKEGCDSWAEAGERVMVVETLEEVRTLGGMARIKSTVHMTEKCVNSFVASRPEGMREGLMATMGRLVRKAAVD